MTRDEAIGLAHYALATAQIEPIADMFLREVAESRKEALEEAARLVDGRAEERFVATHECFDTPDPYRECARVIRDLAKIGGPT